VGVDTTARLKQIDVSTLIIAGELDQGAPVAMSQTMCEQIAGARLVVLKDASHLSAIEQPEAFAAAVEAFVARLA
jgi:3-oxoadipate enol-lactonase